MGKKRSAAPKGDGSDAEEDAPIVKKMMSTNPNKNKEFWDINTFSKSDNKHGMVEESSFACMFPKYREKYVRECFPLLEKAFSEHQLKLDLDLKEGTITVRTTRKTWDPYVIIKARDVVRLVSRSVPYENAITAMDDEKAVEIIKISSMCREKARLIKRRARLVGNDGATLKAIELLTGCYVGIQGRTVCAIGSFEGLKQVEKIVEDCVGRNIHPIFNIKALMIRRELMKNEQLKNESWERFLPKFKKHIRKLPSSEVKKNTKKKIREKKPYNPFPDPIPKSKVDIMLETGEYFMTAEERKELKKKKRDERLAEAKQKRAIEYNKELVPKPEASLPKETIKKDATPVDIKKLSKKAAKAL